MTPKDLEERLKAIQALPPDQYAEAFKQQMVEILDFPLPVDEIMARAAITLVAGAMLQTEPEEQQSSLCCALSFALLVARFVWDRNNINVPYITIRENGADEPDEEKNEDAEIREIATAQPASSTKH